MKSRLAILLLLSAAPAAAQLLVREPELPPGAAPRWSRAQAAIDADLRAGKWDRAASGAQKLLDEMVARVAHGKGTEPLFARAALARGIARAGLGRHREAVWDFWQASALDPEIGKVDLATWGAAGELLAAKVAEDAERSARVVHPCTGSDCDGFALPKQLESHEPLFPRGSVQRCSPGAFQVSAVVGEDGWLHHPILVDVREPTLAFMVLETLRRSRFQPATAGGKPVAVLQQFEIHLRLPLCEGF